MAQYYLDASALVKRYSAEIGGAYVRQICHPDAGHSILISRITTVEVVAAFSQKAYRLAPGAATPEITEADRDQAIALFRQDIESGAYMVIPVNPTICLRAGNLTTRYRTRAYDAIQLATALEIQEALATGQTTSMTFLAADSRLLGYASAEGLAPENPETMP